MLTLSWDAPSPPHLDLSGLSYPQWMTSVERQLAVQREYYIVQMTDPHLLFFLFVCSNHFIPLLSATTRTPPAVGNVAHFSDQRPFPNLYVCQARRVLFSAE